MKLVVYDLEVSPAMGFFYPPLYQTNILKVEKYQVLMSFSCATFDGSKLSKIKHVQLSDFAARFKKDRWDDTDVTKALYRELEKADAVLAHNGKSFDNKMANTFFIKAGLDPLPEFKTVDTLKAARTHFRFASNKLDEIAKELGIEGKTAVTVGALWHDYMITPNWKKAGKLLKAYNNQDIQALFDIYMKLRPFIKNHPNVAIYGDKHSCPVCGGRNFTSNGIRATNTMIYRRLNCKECGAPVHQRLSDKDDQNKPEYMR